jgi:branched-subunit amino acid transport protein
MLAGMALVTFSLRYPVLALLSRFDLPEPILRALRFVPPAVLAAIILPPVLLPDGELTIQYTNAPLVASLVSVLVAWRTKNLLLTILIGMLALWGWRWLLTIY